MSVATAEQPGVTRRFGVLRWRAFQLLWLGETTSSLGTSVGRTSLPMVALLSLHADVRAVSLLTAFAWLPWLLVGLPVGAWVDRLPRRRVMLVADAASATVFTSVVVATVLGRLTIVHLFSAALAAGIAAVFFQPAYRALLPTILGPDDLLEGNAKLQGSEQVANMAGPGVAGGVAQAVGAVGGVGIDAVTFVVSFWCLRRLHVAEPSVDTTSRRLRADIAEGFRFLARDPLLRSLTVFGGLANFMLTGYQAILVVFLVRVVGLSVGATGLLLAATSAGGVLGALVARPAARRFGTARTVLVAKLGVTPFGLLIPFARDDWRLALFVLGSVVVIAGVVAGNVVWSGFTQAFYPPRMLGRISASSNVLNYGAIPLGAAFAGVLASGIGTRAALTALLTGLIGSSLVLLASPLRRMRDLPTVRTPAPTASGFCTNSPERSRDGSN